jgi:hypothetical protein
MLTLEVLRSTAAFNLITSTMVIIIPVPTLIKLKKHRPEVKQLLGLILLGLIHTGLTVARFVIMFYPDPLTKSEPQYTHITTNSLAVVEMDIGIWVATLVVMRSAFQALYYKVRPDKRKEGSSSALYYAHTGSGKGSNGYKLKGFSARSRKMEDEFRILETTEIHMESAPVRRGTPNESDADILP